MVGQALGLGVMEQSKRSRLTWGACCLLFLLTGCSWLAMDEAPTAIISATPATGQAPLTVQLSGALSNDDAAILEYSWDFPDQGVDPVKGIQTERRFQQSGEYRVRLTVRDSAGQSDTDEIIIQVQNVAPMASCRFSNDAPVLRESVLFDASASMDTDGQLIDFIWNFGDGTTQRGTRVSHAYEQMGLYIVQLTVVDNAGASATTVHTITVHEGSSGGGCGYR